MLTLQVFASFYDNATVASAAGACYEARVTDDSAYRNFVNGMRLAVDIGSLSVKCEVTDERSKSLLFMLDDRGIIELPSGKRLTTIPIP